jgi:hypothetical protein
MALFLNVRSEIFHLRPYRLPSFQTDQTDEHRAGVLLRSS